MKKCFYLLVFVATLVSGVSAGADSLPSPGSVQQHSENIQDYFRLEKRLKDASRSRGEASPVVKPDTGRSPVSPRAEQKVRVSEIRTGASDILTEEEIRAITGTLEGRVITLSELLEGVEKINALYREKGFVTARALLPAQTVKKGIVVVRLVEGRVGTVRIEGERHTRGAFVKKSLSLVPGDLVRVDRLEKDLRRFTAASQIPVLSEMQPGSDFGTTDLVVHVKEPKRFEARLTADNLGRETTGEERGGVQLAGRNLLGITDIACVGYNQAKGSRTLNMEYGLPVNHRGTRLTLRYATSDIEVKEGEFRGLDLEGDSRDIGGELGHILFVRARSRMQLFAGVQVKESSSESKGFELFSSRVHDYSIGFDYQKIDGSGVWFTRQDITRGFSRKGHSDQFWTLKGNMVRLQQVGTASNLLLKGVYQLSNSDLLPSSEQFQLGGMATVRGYEEGLLIGDRGYLLSAEMDFSLPLGKQSLWGIPLKDQVRGLAFVDHGGTFPFKGNGEGYNSNDYLTSIGTGLRLDLARRFSGRLILGVPLGYQKGNRDDVRVHFTMQAELL